MPPKTGSIPRSRLGHAGKEDAVGNVKVSGLCCHAEVLAVHFSLRTAVVPRAWWAGSECLVDGGWFHIVLGSYLFTLSLAW